MLGGCLPSGIQMLPERTMTKDVRDAESSGLHPLGFEREQVCALGSLAQIYYPCCPPLSQ